MTTSEQQHHPKGLGCWMGLGAVFLTMTAIVFGAFLVSFLDARSFRGYADAVTDMALLKATIAVEYARSHRLAVPTSPDSLDACYQLVLDARAKRAAADSRPMSSADGVPIVDGWGRRLTLKTVITPGGGRALEISSFGRDGIPGGGEANADVSTQISLDTDVIANPQATCASQLKR